jgi:tetratricopeptide (TPR) repeat protein
MVRFTYCLRSIAVLLLLVPVAAQSPVPTVAPLVDQANTSLEANRFAEAARACAAALKRDPMGAHAHTCATSLVDRVQPLATAGNALLGAGDVDEAHALCSALLILDPANTDAQRCAAAAGARITARAQERLKLEQTAGLIERAAVPEATKLLTELATSNVPAHLDRARELQERLNDQALSQLNASRRAVEARRQLRSRR